MTSNDIQAVIEGLFDELSCRRADDDEVAWKDDFDSDGELAECAVTSFAEGGYLTRDAGMVVRLADGAEFQITIVQSRHAPADEDEGE